MAIIRKNGRPAFPVTAPGEFDLTGEWKDKLEPHRERIARATASVGRLMIDGHPDMPWVGTTFVCGPRLAFTASFSVLTGATGGGEHVRVKDGIRFWLELVGGGRFQVERVVFLHPYYRVALLELEDAASTLEPIPIVGALPEDLGGKEVVLLAYVATDPRNDIEVANRVYGGDRDRLFVQPGKVTQIGRLRAAEAPGLLHDCSSMGGSGGGVLLDPATGEALGVHTTGTYLRGNYAELLWEVARDPVVWKHAIAFRPDPRPSWLGLWEDAIVPTRPQLAPPPAAPPRGWTVDVVPIDFTAAEFKALERALYGTITEVELAMNLALDVGVTRGTVDGSGSAQLVWRRILERASAKGVLRNLVQSIHDNPEYAGLKGVTAQVL